MSTQINLKEIERKAFLSTYQDGLWDIYYGLILMAMAIFMFRPAGGYKPTNILLAILAFTVAFLIFWAGKKFVILPRMGQVTFGPARKQQRRTLAIILSVVVLIQAGFLALQLVGWANPEFGQKISSLINDRDLMHMLVASIGALFIGPPMILVAYFTDFSRGYYIAILMSLAVFLMILLNRPIYPILLGAMVAIPGVVLFVRFLQKYPLR